MRPESITAMVLALIPVSLMITVGFVAAYFWLSSPSSEPLPNSGYAPVKYAAIGTAAVAADPSLQR